jgi:hypothetical protein
MTRRHFIRTATITALGTSSWANRPAAGGQAVTRPARHQAFRLRPDLRDPSAPKGVEIIQLTPEAGMAHSHIYMEAQIFTPDSRKFIFQRSGHAHGSDRKDPQHQFVLCDIEDNFAVHPLTEELGTTGPSVSPDGRYLYYFVDRGKKAGPWALKRVRLDGTDRQTLFETDGPLPGTDLRVVRFYPLSTISSDGKRLAISGSLSHRKGDPPPYGLLIFDLDNPGVRLILQGTTWNNMHPQYCRSADALLKRDILIQENMRAPTGPGGQSIRPPDPLGADIHVIRDDGTDFRDLPWGRDVDELCQGHQCWRGQSDWAITSTVKRSVNQQQLIESKPVPAAGHIGLKAPGGVRNQLSREFPDPHFYHFAVDRAGRRFITDAEPFTPAARIYIARLCEPGQDPLTDFVCLARPRPTPQKTAHMHPFLSPDGRMAFFNSDESGLLQAYAIRGFAG